MNVSKILRIFLLISIQLFVFFIIVDSLTLKDVREESVSCLDKYSRPFEDEMCTKTIQCSFLGIISDGMCSDLIKTNTGDIK